MYFEFLVEGFYTHLIHPFANEVSLPDENGLVTFLRVNADQGAVVKGLNLEAEMIPSHNLSINTGFTWQSSMYEEAQEFNEVRFLRTPETYGFMTANWNSKNDFGISITGNYTGKMLVPHYGIDPDLATVEMLASFENGEIIANQHHSNSND